MKVRRIRVFYVGGHCWEEAREVSASVVKVCIFIGMMVKQVCSIWEELQDSSLGLVYFPVSCVIVHLKIINKMGVRRIENVACSFGTYHYIVFTQLDQE